MENSEKKNNNGFRKIIDALKKAADDKEKALSESQPQPPLITPPPAEMPSLPKPSYSEAPIPQEKSGVAGRSVTTNVDKRVISYYSSNSQITEQFRVLRTHIFSPEQANLRTVAITSSSYGEGKTVTAVNLAVVAAQDSNKSVALLDCNLRKPAVDTLLGLNGNGGLGDILSGRTNLNDTIISTGINNLMVITAGEISTAPTELLGSTRMKELLGELKAKFDCVILDTPAIMPYADPRVLGPLVDGVVIVVKAGKTRREVVSRAESVLKNVGANILGYVLTGIEYHIPEYIHRHL